MKIVQVIAGTLAALILLMAVAVPIIANMEENTADPVYSDNAVGDGYKMAKSSTASIVVAKTSDGVTAGGSAASTGYAIVSSSMALTVTSTGFTVISSGLVQACNTAGDTMTISGSSWSLAYTDSDSASQTATGTFSWIYLPDTSGEYVNTSAPVFVDDDSEIVIYGTAANSGRLVAKGTIESGMDTVFKYTSATATYSISSEESEYTNTLSSVTATLSGSTSSFTTFIVPVEYTSDLQPSLTTSLVSLTPVILVVALLIGIIGATLVKKYGEDF